MAGSFYVGPNPSDLIFDGLGERFFYGLRRTDDGELFLAKISYKQVWGSSKKLSRL